MKIFRTFIALTMAILAFSFVSVNAQSFSDTAAQGPIERQVERKILRLPYYEVFDHIGYSVDGSTVTLFGKVRTARNKKDAEAYVEDIQGVDRVINNIEILPLGSFDDSIRAGLYRRISNTGGLSRYVWPNNPSVRLIVDRGHVTLEGVVSSQSDSHSMNIAANTVPGVFSVTNNLVVDSSRVR